MKSLVLKAMMPVAAFVLASAGAIGTNNVSTDSKGTAVQGWKRIAPFNCEAKKVCNNLSSVICVDGVDQMYAKPTPTSDCEQLLTHRP
jgi:hypothetical protein